MNPTLLAGRCGRGRTAVVIETHAFSVSPPATMAFSSREQVFHLARKRSRASDPKVGTGFGINPMLNQLTGAAALIPFDRPPR
ncbi:hypothetical protein [Nitrobacter sp.]|uniref:hypothetical protein n=1 Tax=unclassified Nitrobacter TaxID=2620411 RepID=UPI00321F68ED